MTRFPAALSSARLPGPSGPGVAPDPAVTRVAAHAAQATIGELAVPASRLAPETPASVIDERFRTDPTLRSVVMCPAAGLPVVLSREEVQSVMTGPFGYGRLVFARHRVDSLFSRPALVLAAETQLGEASSAILARGARRYEDVVVDHGGGRIGLLAVALVFEHLARYFAARALHDTLTGLPNRVFLAEHLEQALRPVTGRPALLYVDLDGFKGVNDSLGHDAGDELLARIGERLRACVRPGDTVARLGGDEFGVLLPGASAEAAAQVADRILLATAAPLLVGGRVTTISASVGIAHADDPSLGPEDLLRRADQAMYVAKRRGRGRAECFDARGGDRGSGRQGLAERLRAAISAGEIALHYQPKIDLATGRVAEVEGLARWHDSERGPVGPAEFVALAEEVGLIGALGRHVLELACRQARAWRDDLGAAEAPVVGVNVSPSQLASDDLIDDVRAALARHGLPAQALRLEVTEHVAVEDVAGAAGRLAALRDLGVRLALDDFGTGYSSLALLHRLPVDCVKLDKSFIDDVDAGDGSGGQAALVGLIIAGASAMGLTVCAEGVERTTQAEVLVRLGCGRAQGFLFARPAAASAITPLLARQAAGGRLQPA